MKIVRFQANQNSKYGILQQDIVRELKQDPFSPDFVLAEAELGEKEYPLSQVQLLTPCQPSKYLGVGMNFKSVAQALGRPIPQTPVTFLKPSTAVIGPQDAILLPEQEQENYLYEGELAVVIGKKAKNVSQQQALDYVLGYTCSNDITDFTQVDRDALRFKGADTFGVIGPCIETDLDAAHAQVKSWVNGELRQNGNTQDMIFDIPYMIAYFSSFMTLLPGDVISMGTPPGAGPIRPGDQVEILVEGIGMLANPVARP